nr:hypothetical protein [Lachnospiraceae bacterium]
MRKITKLATCFVTALAMTFTGIPGIGDFVGDRTSKVAVAEETASEEIISGDYKYTVLEDGTAEIS